MPQETKKVGVFVNPSKEMIDEVVSKLQELIMYSFMEMKHQNFVDQSLILLLKPLVFNQIEDLENIHEYSCEYVLLDGPKGKYHGGNGISFDWRMLSTFDFKDKKVILAGGLHPENVTAAIAEYKVL